MSLFGQSTANKPTPSLNLSGISNTGGSLFGGATNTGAGSSLFGAAPANNTNTAAAPASNSLFGAANTDKPATTSLFGNTTGTQPAGGSLFGNTNTAAQPASNSLFGAPAAAQPAKPSLFGTNTTTQPAASTSLFGAPAQQQTTSLFGAPTVSQNATSIAPTGASSSNPQIDLAHLRSTTKFDHLVPDIQNQISQLDTAILNQIKQCGEVADLIPSVVTAGSQIAPALEFVSGKLEELETGLENDADGIVSVRDGDLKRDEGEAKCVFRAIDRLKIPRQYQVAGAADGTGAAFGGVGNGLSGWWNQPATLRGSSIRAVNGAAGTSVQLFDEDAEDDSGPKNLVGLLEERVKDMETVNHRHQQLLGEIEDFVGALEGKVSMKEREVGEKIEGGSGGSIQADRDHQMQLLRYVFGEVQRGLYEVAEKIGSTRDDVVELGMRR